MVHRFVRRRAVLVVLVLLPGIWSCGSDSGNDPLTIGGPPPHDVEIVQDAPNAGANAFSPPNVMISLASNNTIVWFNADLSGSYD